MEVFLVIGYINMNIITFIEQYCLINGKYIKLKSINEINNEN